jgi:hypothetical protein
MARRAAAWFLLKFALIYAVLMLPMTGLDVAYADAYRLAAQTLYGSFGHAGVVSFAPSGRPEMTAVSLSNTLTGSRADTEMYTRRSAYASSALVIALVASSPVPFSRKLTASGAGLLIVNAYCLCMLGVVILFHYASAGPIAQFEVTGASERLLILLKRLAALSPAYPMAAIVIWLGVTFRQADWSRLQDLLRPSTPVDAKSDEEDG